MSSRWMSRPYQPSPSSPGTSQIELGPRKQPRILFAYHIFPRVTSEAVVPGRHWGTCAWSHTRTSLRRRLLPPMRPFPLSATLLPPPEGWMLRYGAAFGEGLRPFRFDRREQSHFWAWSIPLNYLYRFCFSICFFYELVYMRIRFHYLNQILNEITFLIYIENLTHSHTVKISL